MRNRFIRWLFRKYINEDIEKLWSTQARQDERIAELEKKIDQLRSEVNLSEIKTGHMILNGLLEYLGVSYKREWEDDPSYPEPERQKIEVMKVYKNEKL